MTINVIVKSANIMKPQEEINQLTKRIEELIKTIKNCNHDFATPIYDPEEKRVQDDHLGFEQHGVDRWLIPSFHTEKIPRWSRECTICGCKEYTYETSPVINSYESIFRK